MADKMTDFLPLEHGPAFAWSPHPEAQMLARDEDTDADGGDENEDGDDAEEDGDDLADLSEDELREELKKTRASLKTANGQSAKRRRRLRERERELEEARKPKPKKKDDDDDAPDLDTVREEARREGEKAGTIRAKRSEARAALRSAGVATESLDYAIRSLDLDDMDLDDDGLDGIEDAIEDLKTAVPALFARKRRKRESVAGEADRDGRDVARKPKTASEKAAAQLLGRS